MQRKFLRSLFIHIIILILLFLLLFFLESMELIKTKSALTYFFIAFFFVLIDLFLSSRLQKYLQDTKDKSKD
ncbi:MAG TPA: hypothetical protein VFD08_03095 [Clostridia bacterium]|nr:hypothetical protein [Clostridia bacterium]